MYNLLLVENKEVAFRWFTGHKQKFKQKFKEYGPFTAQEEWKAIVYNYWLVYKLDKSTATSGSIRFVHALEGGDFLKWASFDELLLQTAKSGTKKAQKAAQTIVDNVKRSFRDFFNDAVELCNAVHAKTELNERRDERIEANESIDELLKASNFSIHINSVTYAL